MKKKFDLSLYLVTDRPLSLGRPIEWIVEQAVRGGVTMVQLREKECCTRDFVALALSLKKTLTPLNIPLIINDRIDIALACDADGVHIGQSDMPYSIARQLLGNDKIIGLSVETLEQAIAANEVDVDYIGVSPVFGTPTKTDTLMPFGLEGLTKVAQLSKHRIVGIGGMNAQTAKAVIEAGAEGVAVVSAIVSAKEPCLAAQQIKELL